MPGGLAMRPGRFLLRSDNHVIPKGQEQGAGSRQPSSQEIQDTILADVRRFAGDVPQSDDIALDVLIRD